MINIEINLWFLWNTEKEDCTFPDIWPLWLQSFSQICGFVSAINLGNSQSSLFPVHFLLSFFFFFFFFSATLFGVWDLSSLTMDWTQVQWWKQQVSTTGPASVFSREPKKEAFTSPLLITLSLPSPSNKGWDAAQAVLSGKIIT